MSFRTKAADIFLMVTPEAPHVGPPIPSGVASLLYIQWPASMTNKIPQPIYEVGYKMNMLMLKTANVIRGY